MKNILTSVAPWIAGMSMAFGLGIVLGDTRVKESKPSHELPVHVIVRQPDVEPTVLYVARAAAPGKWYELPPGYRIISMYTPNQNALPE
jgi:hypothetical protein